MNTQQPVGMIESQFSLMNEIGSGSYSTVYYGIDICSNSPVAVKVLNDEAEEGEQKVFDNEIKALKQINHVNVIKIKGHGTRKIQLVNNPNIKKHKYIALEVAERGELFDYLYFPKQGFDERIGKFIFKEILNGLTAIHNAKIAHRDLKVDNILVNKDYKIKIADFGFAKSASGKLCTLLGTLNYACPEILRNKNYDGFKSDIFSLGVILFIIVSGKFPFDCARQDDKYYRYIFRNKRKIYWSKVSENNEILIGSSEAFKTLFMKMVSFNENDRPTLEQIKKDPWLRNDMASEKEVVEDLKLREEVIQYAKNEFVNSNSTDSLSTQGNSEVYRGGDDQNGPFDRKQKIKKCMNDLNNKNLFNNCIVIGGKIDPYTFMNKFSSALTDKNLNVQYSDKSVKLTIIYQADEDDEENEENNDEEEEENKENDEEENDTEVEKSNLLVKISIKQCNESDKYVLLFNKKSGDKFDFYKKVENLRQIAKDLLNASK